MCQLALFHNSIDDTLDRGFKELRDIGSVKVSTETTDTRYDRTHPRNFSWPKRMPQVSSLSLVDPNFMNCGSSMLRKRSMVVLSKHRMMWSRSSMNGESARSPGEGWLVYRWGGQRKEYTVEEVTGVDADENRPVKVA